MAYVLNTSTCVSQINHKMLKSVLSLYNKVFPRSRAIPGATCIMHVAFVNPSLEKTIKLSKVHGFQRGG